VVILASVAHGVCRNKLQTGGFGFIATLAYSLYLTHKEIVHLDHLFLLRYVEAGRWLALLIYFTTSFLAASLLYLLVERPFLRWREKLSSAIRGPSLKTAAEQHA
jgi:peptidoglycan/LPS O-acetylase OafA/YrhL